MNRGVRAFSSVFTEYLCHRDVLTANMTRFGAGFVLDSHLRDAREECDKIKSLIDEVERRKKEAKTYEINCGACYKK